jgi:SAM-dependent methyltransferase
MKSFSDLYWSPLREDVIKLFKKFFRNHISDNDMHTLFRLKLDDNMFIEQLRESKASSSVKGFGPDEISEYRGLKRVNDITSMLSAEEHECIKEDARDGGRYLDIGASDGSITTEIAREFSFMQQNIYAVDIDAKVGSVNNIPVKEYDGTSLMYANNFFCLVSFYQVLHHVRDLSLLKDVSRCTKGGGYLIIREHNKPSPDSSEEAIAFDKLVELEHAIYDIVLLNTYKNYEEFKEHYYASCKSKYNWSEVLKTYGFTFVRGQEVRTPNVPSIGIPGSSSHRREPTRHYYAIYRKNKKFRAMY